MQDIEFYQEAYPDLHEQYREELEAIKHLMEMLRMKRDRPPGGLPVPRS